jgi:hypothetical protein
MTTTWPHLTSPMTQDTFENEFARLNNLQCLDAGAYAKVYGSETSEYVYKIGYYDTLKKDPYLSYLKAIAGKDNPLFPKIRTVTLFRHKDDYGVVSKFFVVEMEKLKNFNGKKSSQPFIELYDSMTQHLSYGEGPVTTIMDNNPLIKKIAGVSPVLKLLHRLGEKFCPDWHSSNMMMRENGHLVITDPVD